MNLKCCSFEKFYKDIVNNKKKIIMFGAGVVGQISTMEILKEYNLLTYLDCFIDNDQQKWGQKINIADKIYVIKSPQYLNECGPETLILLNISRFYEVIEQLENLDCTRDKECYLMPMMLIHNFCMAKSQGVINKKDSPCIPAVINYMWFGKKTIPDKLKKCIESWHKMCPDFEIKEWNEDNYDISKSLYMKQAYENRAYGFIPDYARLDILFNYGGFYLDTDVEIIKCLEPLRYQEAFCGVEKWQVVNFGGCSGAQKGHPMIKRFLDARKDVLFLDSDGKQNKNTCGFYDTKTILKLGYKINGCTQNIQGMNIYPYDYFHPYDYMSGLLNKTENTYSIHHFNGGWLDENMREQNEITRKKYLGLYESCYLNDC